MHKKPFGQILPESNGPETNSKKRAGRDTAPARVTAAAPGRKTTKKTEER